MRYSDGREDEQEEKEAERNGREIYGLKQDRRKREE